jgi:hypothetical protein
MFPEAAHRAVDDRNPCLLARSLAAARWSDPGLMRAQMGSLLGEHVLPRAAWKLGCWRDSLRSRVGAHVASGHPRPSRP